MILTKEVEIKTITIYREKEGGGVGGRGEAGGRRA